jgi:hypothetical protein
VAVAQRNLQGDRDVPDRIDHPGPPVAAHGLRPAHADCVGPPTVVRATRRGRKRAWRLHSLSSGDGTRPSPDRTLRLHSGRSGCLSEPKLSGSGASERELDAGNLPERDQLHPTQSRSTLVSTAFCGSQGSPGDRGADGPPKLYSRPAHPKQRRVGLSAAACASPAIRQRYGFGRATGVR